MSSYSRFWVRVITLLLVLAPGAALAGRPLDTEDTGTVEPGKAELELSGDFARNPEDNSWSTRAVLSFGLISRLEARIESTLLFLEPRPAEDDEEAARKGRGGIGDSLLGFKYRLLDDDAAVPAVLGSLTLRLPTGDEDRGLGAEDVDVGLLAVVSKAFGPVNLTLNGGYTFVTRDRNLDFWLAAGAVEYRATKEWSLVGEIVCGLGIHGVHRTPDTIVLRAGSTWAVTDRIKLDGAVGAGLTRDSPDLLITVGVTVLLF
jgi:hypothetical protein